MRNIIFTLLYFTHSVCCKAQSPIIDIASKNTPDDITGVYFKDTNNILDKFVGTWKYENGNTSLTIVLVKKIQLFNGEWYNDELIGEYKYVENGTTIVDYLYRLDDPHVNDLQHSIDGNMLANNDYDPICTDCVPNEKRVILDFADFSRRYLRNEILVQYIDDGTEQLRVHVKGSDTMLIPPGGFYEPQVPYGDYILIKQ